MNQGVKNFNSIDLMKFIMSFLVVAIHTNPLKMCNIPAVTVFYDCIVACAVPFFFLASGFLLAQKSTAENFPQIITKHLFKIVKLYLIWSALYLPLAVIHFWFEGESFLRSVLLYFRGFFIVGENYNSWMLWYLLSTIYALIFILFLVKKKVRLTHILILGSILFAIGCVIPSFVTYGGSLPGVLSLFKKALSVVVSGRIFKGFLYIPLGMVLAKKKPSVLWGILLALSGFVGNIFLDGIPEDFVVALCSAGVFILICHINLKNSAVYSVLRSASTGIYFIHMYVWTVYYSIVYQEKTYGLDGFVVTCIVSLLFSLFYTWLQRKRKKQCSVPKQIA